MPIQTPTKRKKLIIVRPDKAASLERKRGEVECRRFCEGSVKSRQHSGNSSTLENNYTKSSDLLRYDFKRAAPRRVIKYLQFPALIFRYRFNAVINRQAFRTICNLCFCPWSVIIAGTVISLRTQAINFVDFASSCCFFVINFVLVFFLLN